MHCDWMRAVSLSGLLLASALSTNAQRTAGAARLSSSPRVSFPSRTASVGLRGSIAGGEFRRFRAEHPNLIYGGSPLWWDEPYQGSSDPAQIILKPGQASSPFVERSSGPSPPLDPLVIELRGDQYVRVSPAGKETTADASTTQRLTAGSIPAGSPSRVASDLPTIFVFRDGHREESNDYSIYDGVIHARSAPWTDGAWMKQIPLSALNIAESRKANDERGVRFVLPAAANEVVTRP